MASNLPEKRTKKERIRELSSDSTLSARDVARIAGTTEANVWKEKSNLKRSGLMVRQKVERSDKTVLLATDSQDALIRGISTRNGTTRQEYQALLEIPPIDPEGMKILYSDLLEGKKPAEIIAAHGFHPDVVEVEYRRVNKLDPRSLADRIITDYVVNPGPKNAEIVKKFRNGGEISEDEVMELLIESTNAGTEAALAYYGVAREKEEQKAGYRHYSTS